MASNINANNIDGTYPIAGVDNDSQGFRTNFTNIKNNMAYAATEISDLQNKVVLKSALTGTTLNNSFGGSPLSAAEIYDLRETENDLGNASGNVILDHGVAHYHKFNTANSVSIAFQNLPVSGKVGRIRLRINVTSLLHTITLPAAVNLGTSSIQGYSSNIITFSSTGVHVFEFITDDQGSNIHIQDLTRSRNKITNTTDSTSYTTGAFTVAGGVGIAGNLYVGGNLVLAGDHVIPYQWANVTTSGNTMAITNTVVLSASGTVSAQKFYFPNSTIAKDGETITVVSNVAITALTIASNGATINGNITTLAANTPNKWFYVAPALSWFKVY